MNNDMTTGMVIVASVWGAKWALDRLFAHVRFLIQNEKDVAAARAELKAEAKPEIEEMVPWWAVATQGTDLHGKGKALGVVTTRAKTQEEAEVKACIFAAMDGAFITRTVAVQIAKIKPRALPEAPAGDRS